MAWCASRSVSKTRQTSSPTWTRRWRRFERYESAEKEQSADAARNPVQVILFTITHLDHDALGHVVRMHCLDGGAKVFKSARCGLDHEQAFRSAFHLTLPAVYRVDLRHNVDACCQPPLHQRLSKLTGLVGGTGGG